MRDDCARVTPSDDSQRPKRRRAQRRPGGEGPGGGEPGILSKLPSTRPQRPSARRVAAKRASGAGAKPASSAATKPKSRSAGAKPAADAGAKPATRPAARRAAASGAKRAAGVSTKPAPSRRSQPVEPPVPPQGFETEGEITPGVPVDPPSGHELAASAVDLLGELAQAGLVSGGRLLKDALARLPGL
jgi:hypothetical protein